MYSHHYETNLDSLNGTTKYFLSDIDKLFIVLYEHLISCI